ncbi:MAG: hypothetical protein JWM44_961 [Bacilli bacterium]|nr:hypothetical protein [Bacilli bacterium]
MNLVRKFCLWNGFNIILNGFFLLKAVDRFYAAALRSNLPYSALLSYITQYTLPTTLELLDGSARHRVIRHRDRLPRHAPQY